MPRKEAKPNSVFIVPIACAEIVFDAETDEIITVLRPSVSSRFSEALPGEARQKKQQARRKDLE